VDDAIADVMLLRVVAVGGEDNMDLLLRDVVVEVKVVCLDDVEIDGESKMEKKKAWGEDRKIYVCTCMYVPKTGSRSVGVWSGGEVLRPGR
jgi:hypothetical protein